MFVLNQFDAIIFDFGGVIINVDYQKTIDSFNAIGVGDFNEIFSKSKQNHISDNFEMGIIGPEQFFNFIENQITTPVQTSDLVKAWNNMLGDIPQKRVDLLNNIKPLIPTYLLSNTNITHIEEINSKILPKFGVQSVHSWFKDVFLSFELGMRKPDPKIFEFVLAQTGTKPEKTLFIDDSPQHITAAEKLGIICHHLLDHEEITNLFEFNPHTFGKGN